MKLSIGKITFKTSSVDSEIAPTTSQTLPLYNISISVFFKKNNSNIGFTHLLSRKRFPNPSHLRRRVAHRVVFSRFDFDTTNRKKTFIPSIPLNRCRK